MKNLSLTLASAALAAASLPLAGGCSNSSPAEQAAAAAGHPELSQSAAGKLRPVAIPPSLRTIAFDDQLFAPPPRPQYNSPAPTQHVAQRVAQPPVEHSGGKSPGGNFQATRRAQVTPLPPLKIPEGDPAPLQGSSFDYQADQDSASVPLPSANRVARLPSVDSLTLPDADELAFALGANAPGQNEVASQTVAPSPRPAVPPASNLPTPVKTPAVQRSVLRKAPPPSALSTPTLIDTSEWSKPPAVPAQRRATESEPQQELPALNSPAVQPAAKQPMAPAYTQDMAPPPQRLATQAPQVPLVPQLPPVIVEPLSLPLVGGVQMDVVRHHSRMLIQRGTELGERGALYSAKTDFLHALRLIAQGQDAAAGDRRHSDALEQAWQALEEAEDFTPSGSRSVDLKQVVTAHRTGLLKQTDLTRLTPLEASQQYFAYAQQQLATAGGDEPVAAEALHCLGKTHVFIARESNESARTHGPMALAMQQAALMVDDHHGGAANELGVLLAKYGQWNDARRVLLHALSIHPTVEKWENLAVVHEHLGEASLAQLAKQEAELATMQLAQQGMQAKGRVRWVNPDAFAQNGQVNPNLPTATRRPAPTPVVPPPAESHSRTAWKWPWVK